MRKKKRNLMHWLLLFTIMLTVHSSVIFAAENNNTTAETATTINVNTSYSDNLTDSSDVNWYKFTLSDDGAISLEFTHDYLESSTSFWKAYLYDSSQNELAGYSFAGNTTTYTQGQIGVPAGSYYLKIVDSSYSDANYNIKINFTQSNGWETEFNDDYSSADSISVNSVYYGSLRTSSDTDWYKFTLDADGYISLTFTHDFLESNNSFWKAYLYDSSQNELVNYSYKGDTSSYVGEKIAAPTGIYYLKIVDSSYSDLTYNLKINFDTKSDTPSENPFVDVSKDDYYYDAVLWAYENGITTGKDDTHFQPSAPCNRAQSVTFLWRAFGKPEPETTNSPFVDVTTSDYYYKAVLWAYENGITNGSDKTHFAPSNTVTRKEFLTFLWRADGEPQPTTTENPFVDVPNNRYYTKAVLWAYENGITNGKDATHFQPDNKCIRAQVVSFLYRYFN